MRIRNAIHIVFSLLLAAGFLGAGQLIAQGLFGTISGAVTDATGAIIPGATVKVININTNVTKTMVTNGAGEYSASSLNPGTYKVEASAKGFKGALRSGIVVEVDSNPKISIKLEIGAATETVTVTGQSEMIQTQESSISQTVDEQQLGQLPVAGGGGGRDTFSLLALSAGVSQQKGEGADGAYDNTRMNGGRSRSDDYLIDGTSSEAAVWGGPTVNPSPDSVEELRVQTNDFAAEYGKASGGIVSITTKSGTNAFHGSAYEYYQTSKLNANSFFSNLAGIPIAPYHYDEFGGTVGGRVVKNKVFFFTDYQGVRATSTWTQSGSIVPNDSWRSGDLSALGKQLHYPANYPNASLAGKPILNNQVPVGSIAKAIEALWPEGNAGAASQPGANVWNGIGDTGTKVNRVNPRGDWFLKQNDHIFGVFHYQTSHTTNKTVGWLDSDNYVNGPGTNLSVGWTHTFSAALLNDFRFGLNFSNTFRTDNGFGLAGDGDFGISGVPACNYAGSGGTKCGTPGVGFSGAGSGFSGVGGGGAMLIQPQHTVLYNDSLTWIRGHHSFKFGGEIRSMSIQNIQPNSLTGGFSFNGGGTGDAWADFLLGYLNKSSIQVQTAYLTVKEAADGVFAQDDWKVTPKLTLNLGVRWQYDPSATSDQHDLASFNPYNLTWTQPGVNGAPAGTIATHWKEYAPRVGFSYNPLAGLVVHGGYGITYPGTMGHGRGGDGNVSPNILPSTQFNPGTYISNLSAINLPAANGDAPLAMWQGEYFSYTPYKQGTTYSEMWNLTIQKELGQHAAMSVSYSGSHGVHLPVNYSYNLCQQSAANIAQYGAAIYNGIDSPYCASGNAAALGGFYGDYVDPGWWGLSSSVYHSMQATFQKRASHGLTVLSNFTWSKLIDDSSSDWGGFGALDTIGQDFYHRKSERSVSAGDIPLSFMLSPIYELPLGYGQKWLNKGVAGQLLGGFRLSAIYTASKGDPVGITDGGWQYGNLGATIGQRPNLTGNPSLSNRSRNEWFNTNAFDWSGTWENYTKTVNGQSISVTPHPEGQSIASMAFGNAPRFLSSVRSPSISNLDASIQKEFKIPYVGDQGRLRLQLDAFNALNHTEFAPPVSTASPQFGQILSTRNNGRVVQLGVHAAF